MNQIKWGEKHTQITYLYDKLYKTQCVIIEMNICAIYLHMCVIVCFVPECSCLRGRQWLPPALAHLLRVGRTGSKARRARGAVAPPLHLSIVCGAASPPAFPRVAPAALPPTGEEGDSCETGF